MSIRYRLLLIVGLVTSLVFVFAFFLNNHLLMTNIQKIREETQFFQQVSMEKSRKNLEEYIYDDMSKRLAQINAILETISQFPSLSAWFSPTSENLRLGTWAHAAHFLQDEDWIQFLQNTSESKLLSLVIPETGPFFQTKRVFLEEGLDWVFIEDSKAYKKPCLGVQLPFKSKEDHLPDEMPLVVTSSLPIVHALYTLDQLRTINFSSDFLQNRDQTLFEPSIQGYEIDEEKFYSFLMRAVDLSKSAEFKIPEKKEEKEAAAEAQPTLRLSEQYLKQILDYSNELFLIGEITALQRANFFGSTENQIHWPEAISFYKQGTSEGNVFFLNSVLGFSKPYFDDEAFFKKHPPAPGSFVSSGSAVIKSPHPNQVFFVNTSKFHSEVGDVKKESFLTIGFDMNEFLYTLASISARYGCMISDNKVLTEIVPEGSPQVHFELIPDLLAKQQDANKGVFSLGDTEYFFLKLKPDPSLDLYLCFFASTKDTFSLFYQVQGKVKAILHHVWVHRIILEFCSLLILWVLLLDLSKKITKPIVALSHALRYVKTGEWDSIKIPEIKFHKNNEIKQLVSAFQDMVEGMKEKEKMSGILNKVVSKEIAQEILKGEVHLGGEEKVVTMLFADIRGFTQLTQNMEPHDIINLLNTCMTKLSQVIEANKGVIDKYLGDGIMALYGAPISYKESPLCAVMSGLEMIAIIQKWDEERIEAGQVPLNIGIGIHTGTVCAGNMGALNRLNYTVIGSHVNMASRLCYAAGPAELLITEDTYLHPSVHQNVEVEDKGFMSFKGFDEKKRVYKVIKLKNTTFENVLVLQGDE